jgi:hypothetical protein
MLSVKVERLARIFYESLAATTDMAVLPGVLGCRTLRPTVQVRLGTNILWLPGGTPIFAVSRQQFIEYSGLNEEPQEDSWRKCIMIRFLTTCRACKG